MNLYDVCKPFEKKNPIQFNSCDPSISCTKKEERNYVKFFFLYARNLVVYQLTKSTIDAGRKENKVDEVDLKFQTFSIQWHFPHHIEYIIK